MIDLFQIGTRVNPLFTINLRSAPFRTQFLPVHAAERTSGIPGRETTMFYDNQTTADHIRRRTHARAAGDMRLILSVALFAVFAAGAAGAMVVTTSI